MTRVRFFASDDSEVEDLVELDSVDMVDRWVVWTASDGGLPGMLPFVFSTVLNGTRRNRLAACRRGDRQSSPFRPVICIAMDLQCWQSLPPEKQGNIVNHRPAFRITGACFLFVVGWLSLSGTSISAQDAAGENPGAGTNAITNFKGKLLKSMRGGVIIVTREDGTEVTVAPPDEAPSFQFVAKAKAAFIGRGTLVRFTGTFNQAGVAQAPIDKVEIFQPVSGKMSGHFREKFTPGVHTDRRDRDAKNSPVAKVSVVGNVMGLDPSGLLMVQAGKIPVRAPLAPDVEFEIRLNNLNLAQEGDSVQVSGFYQPPDESKVKASKVTITTDRVYGEPSADQGRRKPRTRTRRTTKKLDDGDQAKTDDGDQAKIGNSE